MGATADRLAALDAEREFLAACEKVSGRHEDAKAALKEALTGGDEKKIAAAQRAKNKAALELNEFRAWARTLAAQQDTEDGVTAVQIDTVPASGQAKGAGGR